MTRTQHTPVSVHVINNIRKKKEKKKTRRNTIHAEHHLLCILSLLPARTSCFIEHFLIEYTATKDAILPLSLYLVISSTRYVIFCNVIETHTLGVSI